MKRNVWKGECKWIRKYEKSRYGDSKRWRDASKADCTTRPIGNMIIYNCKTRWKVWKRRLYNMSYPADRKKRPSRWLSSPLSRACNRDWTCGSATLNGSSKSRLKTTRRNGFSLSTKSRNRRWNKRRNRHCCREICCWRKWIWSVYI